MRRKNYYLPMLHRKAGDDRSIKNQSPSKHYEKPKASLPLMPFLGFHLRPPKQAISHVIWIQVSWLDLQVFWSKL